MRKVQESMTTGRERKKLKQQNNKLTVVASKLERDAEKIVPLSKAFQKIRKATGLGDMDQVIEAYKSQEARMSELDDLYYQRERRIITLKETVSHLKQRLDNIHYFGMDSRERDTRREVLQGRIDEKKRSTDKLRRERALALAHIGSIENGIQTMHKKLLAICPIGPKDGTAQCVPSFAQCIDDILISASGISKLNSGGKVTRRMLQPCNFWVNTMFAFAFA